MGQCLYNIPAVSPVLRAILIVGTIRKLIFIQWHMVYVIIISSVCLQCLHTIQPFGAWVHGRGHTIQLSKYCWLGVSVLVTWFSDFNHMEPVFLCRHRNSIKRISKKCVLSQSTVKWEYVWSIAHQIVVCINIQIQMGWYFCFCFVLSRFFFGFTPQANDDKQFLCCFCLNK